jgi:hypothetical protein
VAFHVQIADWDQAYWDDLPLSPRAKESLERQLADLPDDFRLAPANRPYPDDPYFFIRYIIRDFWGDRHLHAIDLYVNDAHAEVGVLLIEFMEHQRAEPR